MELAYQFVMSAPKPLMALIIFLLGAGFATVSIMNKNLRRKLRDLRRELYAALKGHPRPRKQKKQTKQAHHTSRKEEVRVPPRPT